MSGHETTTKILRDAADAVSAAGLPDAFEAVAFGKAVDLIAGAAGPAGTVASGRDGSRDLTTGRVGAVGTSDDKLLSIANALGIDPEVVRETYHLEDEEIGLSITSSQLDSQVGRAAQEIALLVAAARQGSGDEEWTATASIRAVADDYGRLNRHFAESIDDMGDLFSFSGTGRTRRVKLKRTGFERVAALVQRLQGRDP